MGAAPANSNHGRDSATKHPRVLLTEKIPRRGGTELTLSSSADLYIDYSQHRVHGGRTLEAAHRPGHAAAGLEQTTGRDAMFSGDAINTSEKKKPPPCCTSHATAARRGADCRRPGNVVSGRAFAVGAGRDGRLHRTGCARRRVGRCHRFFSSRERIKDRRHTSASGGSDLGPPVSGLTDDLARHYARRRNLGAVRLPTWDPADLVGQTRRARPPPHNAFNSSRRRTVSKLEDG